MTRVPVVYFVDHFANFHDPELGWAAGRDPATSRHPGLCPRRTDGVSGMAMISAGDLDSARELAEQNLRELAELAREGLTILCTEPTAAVCLKQEYPLLVNHPDVQCGRQPGRRDRSLPEAVACRGPLEDRLHADGSDGRLSHAVPSEGPAARHSAGRSAGLDPRA